MKRKIAAILAADIVGYSRLVREDEEGTLQRLDGCRAVFSDYITRFGGRTVDMAGDFILAEFQTAIDAVRCAVDAQESLRTQNRAYPPSRQMIFRIGITMGDVLERDGFLLGEGVNIASRLQAIAPAGGICISRSIYEAVAHKITLNFADVGQQQLKNIPNAVHAYTAALDQQVTLSKGMSHKTSLTRPMWGALAVLIIVGLGTAAYLFYSAEQETDSTAKEHATIDSDKCAAADIEKDEAIAACTRMLERGELEPTSRAIYYSNRGGAFLNRGDYDLAIKDLDESLRLNPNAAITNYYRGATNYYKHDFDHAVTDLKRALDLDSKDERSEYYLGRALQGLGRHDEAVTHLTNSIDLNSKNADAYLFRGDVLLDKGDYPSAFSDYDEAIRLNPSHGAAFLGRGIVQLKQEHVEAAISDLTKAIDLDPEDWYAHHQRGNAYVKAGDYAKAADDQTEALRLKSNSAQVLSGRAEALLKGGKLTEAMSDIERALGIEPDLAVALTTRGEIHEALDRKDEAIADFKRALAIDGTMEEAKKGLARLDPAALGAPW